MSCFYIRKLGRFSDAGACQEIKIVKNEYDDVLHREKFPFSEKHIQKILQMFLQFGLAVNPSPTGEILVDMDDLVFYEVVMEKRDDDAYFITGNIRHFPKRDFIVTPAEMLDILHMERTRMVKRAVR